MSRKQPAFYLGSVTITDPIAVARNLIALGERVEQARTTHPAPTAREGQPAQQRAS